MRTRECDSLRIYELIVQQDTCSGDMILFCQVTWSVSAVYPVRFVRFDDVT